MNIRDFDNIVSTQGLSPCFEEYSKGIIPKDFIYHYTTQYTLSEILGKKEIWLSHAMDMNDPSEIFFGVEVLIDILSKNLNRGSKVLKYIKEERNKLQEFNRFVDLKPIFILSFSEKRDDLKQWVHYANNGNGVALEFILSKIIGIINSIYSDQMYPLLMPVNYFYKSKKPIDNECIHFIKFVSNFFSEIDHILEKYEFNIDINFQRTVFDYLVLFAPFIKQNLYFEEKEWRLVVRLGIGDKKIRTKVINNIAQMKLVLSLNENDIINIINSIMIGPINYNNLTNVKALELLMLKELKNRYIRINRSSGELKQT